MDMEITFPGGKKVLADYGEGMVLTDQPQDEGGHDMGPSPYMCFLASVGTCAGYYVLSFCQSRGLDAAGIKVVQNNVFDPETHKLTDIKLEILVPPDFPERYHKALVRAAETCAVKRALAEPPKVSIETKTI